MSADYRGIDAALSALAILAKNEQVNVTIGQLAREVTAVGPDRAAKIMLLVDELHHRFAYAPNPVKETMGPTPITPGSVVDADDACLFVVALAMSVGIPCRFVAARFGRHSWTCFVAYETEDGKWETVDPLRQKVEREPDERILGAIL